MEIRNVERWRQFVADNESGAGLEICEFAVSWANAMEAEIAKGRSVADIAEACYKRAIHHEHLTGSQYAWGVGILAQCWEYGDALKVWHNAQYGIDANDGTVMGYLLDAE